MYNLRTIDICMVYLQLILNTTRYTHYLIVIRNQEGPAALIVKCVRFHNIQYHL